MLRSVSYFFPHHIFIDWMPNVIDIKQDIYAHTDKYYLNNRTYFGFHTGPIVMW